MIRYREIKGGSVLKQIRQYNNREDCFYTGWYKLVYPRPCGDTCGEFLNVCNYTFRVPDNQLSLYRPEEVLSYEPTSVDAAAYGEKALKGNALNAHTLQLLDFFVEGSRVKMEYVVDADAEKLQTLTLPFLYIPSMQFVVTIGIGTTHHQQMAVAFSKSGAVIYEIAETTVFARI
ncbi:hypothetical protein J6S55_00520 [Candidatus Saccharibacteria bacterium]|nr:hypothetical protein [Candidatus Saccharibacteria bacterium]